MQWKDDLVYIPLSLHAYWGSVQCVVGRAWITLCISPVHKGILQAMNFKHKDGMFTSFQLCYLLS